MKLQNARGTRDYGTEDAIARNAIVSVMKEVFERYGFNPVETPALERMDTLTAKYAGGEEIAKEMLRLTDQGKRQLALRYDLTVPLARYVVMNPNLKFPFKRYQIGSVFRDGPVKPGRYREFTQCDADIVGSDNIKRDAELLEMAAKIFEKLGLKAVIKVNNRKIMDGLLDASGLEDGKFETVILTLDKLEKLGMEAVKKELAGKGAKPKTIAKLMEYLAIQGTNKEKLERLKKIISSSEGIDGMKEIEQLLNCLNGNVELDLSLARGLNYYTGAVFEAFLRNSEVKSSIAAGGRYDELIGSYVGNGKEYDAVGISFGLDVITEAVNLSRKAEGRKTVVQAYVISIAQDKEAASALKKLREAGINSDITYSGKVGKSINYANDDGIPYVIFIGSEEAKSGKVKLKDMQTGKEQLLAAEQAIKQILP